MKMKLKKEVKWSVVYEAEDEKAAVASVYVSKAWLQANATSQKFPPQFIALEVKCSTD